VVVGWGTVVSRKVEEFYDRDSDLRLVSGICNDSRLNDNLEASLICFCRSSVSNSHHQSVIRTLYISVDFY
jgi:hypothetical protein